MKKSFFLAACLLFTACSEKTLNVNAVSKPEKINFKLTSVKIGKIKGDNIGLKQDLIERIKYLNAQYPDYLNITANAEYTIKGELQNNSRKKTYYKKLKTVYKHPCVIYLYPCKNISGKFFCKFDKPVILYDEKQIKKSFVKPPYILYKSSIYKYVKKCKPPFKQVKCQSYNIDLYLKTQIYKNSAKIFSESYSYYDVEDPCKNIKRYENINSYEPSVPFKQKISNAKHSLITDFLHDIAPYEISKNIKLIMEPDIKMKEKDELLFKETLQNIPDNIYKAITIFKTLSYKYPKSCAIKYNLAVFYMYVNRFETAKEILSTLNNCKNLSYEMQNEYEFVKKILINP